MNKLVNSLKRCTNSNNRLPHNYINDNYSTVNGEVTLYWSEIIEKKEKITSKRKRPASKYDGDNKFECEERYDKSRKKSFEPPKSSSMGYQKDVNISVLQEFCQQKERKALFKSKTFEPDSENIKLLLSEKSWLGNSIIQKYLSLFEGKNSTFIINNVAAHAILINKLNHDTLFNDIDFSKYNFIAGLVLVDGNHWNCFFANRQDSNFIYLDPYSNKNDAHVMQCYQNWKEFCDIKTGLKKAWTVLNINKQSKQRKIDKWNCGVYCTKYLELLMNSNLNLNFVHTKVDLTEIRSEMYHSLVRNDPALLD